MGISSALVAAAGIASILIGAIVNFNPVYPYGCSVVIFIIGAPLPAGSCKTLQSAKQNNACIFTIEYREVVIRIKQDK